MAMLASLIAGLASGEAFAALRRARMAAIVYVCAGAAAVLGAGFLLAAAFIWAERRYGPIEAALSFGVGFLVIAGLIVLIYRLSAGSRARKQAARRKADLAALGTTAALALLPALARGKGGLGLVLGPAAALIAYAIYRESSPRDPDKTPGPGSDG